LQIRADWRSSFQHSDCLVFARGETLKLFQPRSKRLLGGTPHERLVSGELLVIFEGDLERLGPPSKRYKFANFVTGVPIANFPSITASSLIVGKVVDPDFFKQIHDLLSALPGSRSGWIATFGKDFFARDAMDRCVAVVDYLKEYR